MDKEKKNLIGFFLIFWLFWIMITGNITIVSLALGAVVSFGVVIFNRSMIISPEERAFVTTKNLLIYFKLSGKFLLDIIVANLQVALLVLNPRLPVEPQVVVFNSGLRRELNRVILANAITLTPGTLSVICKDGEYVVHALFPQTAEELEEWSFTKALKNTEGVEP